MTGMNNRLNTAVVLSLGVNGLGIARALGRNNIKVYGFYSSPDKEVGRYSKYVIPCHFNDKDDLLDQLMKIAKKEKAPPVLYSSSDKYIDFMVENNALLKKHFLYSLPQLQTLEKLIDKKKTIKLLEEYNIPHPESMFIKSINDSNSINEILDQVTLPLIVKPTLSWDMDVVDQEKNIVFEDKSDFLNYIKNKKSCLDRIVIQGVIPHDDSDVYYCTGYYDNNSRLLGIFCAQKLRQYLPKYGITSFSVSRTVREVRDQAESFLSSIKYVGLFDIEFIYDHRDKSFKCIEINPRTHLANSHSEFCGVNLPFIAYKDLTNSGSGEMPLQSENIYWLYFQMDRGSCYRKLKKGEISVTEWLSSIRLARSYAVWAKDDPLPFWKGYIK